MDMSNTQLNKLITAAIKSTLADEQLEQAMVATRDWMGTLSKEELEVMHTGSVKELNELIRANADKVSVEHFTNTLTGFRQTIKETTAMVAEVFAGCMSLPDATIETASQCTLAAIMEGMTGEDCTAGQQAFLENIFKTEIAAVAAKEQELMTTATQTPVVETTVEAPVETKTEVTTTVVETTEAKVVAVATVETKPVPAAPVENPIAQLMRETMREEMQEYGSTMSEAWKQALLIARYRIIRDGQKAWEAKCKTGMFGLKHRRSSAAAKAAAEAAALAAHAESMKMAGEQAIVV